MHENIVKLKIKNAVDRETGIFRDYECRI